MQPGWQRDSHRAVRRLQLAGLSGAPAAFSLGWAVREPGEGLDALVSRAARRPVHVRVVERVRDARGSEVEALTNA